jgi:hypothetical protein
MEESLWWSKTIDLPGTNLLNCYILTSYSNNYMNNSW